ncbi:MAG: hypothetical protein A4E62_03213 [Syntrophorhabdus sp. PtaU1.Bin002]|nr:MAG: hypothetical protein A4E62_03213 [Syntrophorhabdus sp. PtaU1.Bin002]
MASLGTEVKGHVEAFEKIVLAVPVAIDKKFLEAGNIKRCGVKPESTIPKANEVAEDGLLALEFIQKPIRIERSMLELPHSLLPPLSVPDGDDLAENTEPVVGSNRDRSMLRIFRS